MLLDYAAVEGLELWNLARLQAYLQNVGSPFTSGGTLCSCDTLTRDVLEGVATPYDTPATDPAPWYDPDLPVSAEFLGFMPLTIDGLGNNPRARNVTNGVGGGGVFGPSRDLPRTITVTGLIIGSTCCGSEYGLHWLGEALASCSGDACDGECFNMYDCCPSTTLTHAQFDAQHKRTYRRTALVSGPTETGRQGTGVCKGGTCQGTGDIIEVEFVLVAASPWPWTDVTPLLDVALPTTGTGDCIEWCLSSGTGASACSPGECQHGDCAALADGCLDPLRTIPTPPSPAQPDSGYCIPLAGERACYTIDLSTRAQWGGDVPVITLSAGGTDLRNVQISFYEKQTGTTQTCDQIADQQRCNPAAEFFVTFVPANGAITIDGQIGRATTECLGECRSASTVFGSLDGGPVKISDLNACQYCVCITVDPLFPPDPDAHFTLGVSGRVY